MEDQSTFQDIVLRHLNDQEDQVLLAELTRLRTLSASNESEFLDIKKLWELSAQASRLQEVDEEKSLQRFEIVMGISKLHKSRKLSFWLSTAASFFLAVFALWLFFSTGDRSFVVKETSAGVIDSIRFADGSQVFLAENSAIRYPDEFDAKTRAVVLLKGKAFFKVAKDPNRPFQVNIHYAVVSVLGTSFNINYTANSIDLSVKTGKVKFSTNSKIEPTILTAGEALSYHIEKKQLSKENGLNSAAWLTKELHFVDMPLEEVCRQLSDYYKVKVVLLAKTSTAKKLNANFSNTSMEDVLQVLKQTYPIKILKKDSIIYVTNR